MPATTDQADRVVFTIPTKRDGEEIRATLSTYRGAVRAHLRLYYRTADGEWKPTQKGVSVPIDHLDTLDDAVHALKAAAQEP